MKITELPFAVLRFQYQLARVPLQLIEEQVVARMETEAPARLWYERSLGMLDTTVGNVLGAPEWEERGAALIERSDARRRAAQLEATADEQRRQADAELKGRRDKAIKDQQRVQAKTARDVKEARSTAQERKRNAAESAQQRTSAVKRQADQVAAKRKNAADSVKREEETVIRADEQRATAAADAKLRRARATRNDAAGKLAEADRVADLADAEKHERQEER